MSDHGRPLTIRFINTFEPISRHYRDLIPFMAARGYHVQVLLSKARYRMGRDESWIREGVSTCHIPCLTSDQQSLVGKFVTMLTFAVFSALFMLFGPRADINLFLTQPPLFVLWGSILKILRHEQYYQIVMDIYPEMAVKIGLLRDDTLLTRILKRLSGIAMRQADGLIVIGRCMKTLLIEKGMDPNRIHFIPNWANHEAVTPLPRDKNLFRQEHGWGNKFVIAYAGNIGIPQYFDDLLETALRMRNRNDVLFAFVGDGSQREAIELFKVKHSLTNLVILPFQPQDTQSLFLSAGDLHFVTLRAGIEGLAVPSKAYSIMAAGRPILYQGAFEGEIAFMIQEAGIGTIVPLNDPNTLEAAILSYVGNPAFVAEQGGRARRLAETEYSYLMACERYITALQLPMNAEA